MRLLLDTHVVIWAVDDPVQLSAAAAQAVQDPANERWLSAASVWEIAIKTNVQKLQLKQPFQKWIDQAFRDVKLTLLPLTVDHAGKLVGLPFHHRDPFDRMLAAQALQEAVPIVSADAIFDAYGVTRLW